MDLLIYSQQKSARLNYIFDHIFQRILGLNIEITCDVDLFNSCTSPKINYSKQAFSDELFFYSSDILFEQGVLTQNLKFSIYNQIPIFFLCNNGALPFDPFAASFYMLTRYEEYTNVKKDKLGRFLVDDSVAFKHKFIKTPVVDHWILFIKNVLLKKFPNLLFKKHTFCFINTIDVDNAYAYLSKGFFRTLGAICVDLIKCNFINIINRIKVLFFRQLDPYNNYAKLLQIHSKYKLKTIFFFLLANYGFYDRNVSHLNLRLQKQIKRISKTCDVGVHTSFNSIKFPKNILIEKNRLSTILNKDVIASRQHFLHLRLPYYYRNLIKYGITHDYSMGFPSHPGFRAGTSYSFRFFDLLENTTTSLVLYPFSVMDISLKKYLRLTPNQAFLMIREIVNNVKYVNGTFISIWHNESLSYLDDWKNWNFVYEKMIKFIFDEKN